MDVAVMAGLAAVAEMVEMQVLLAHVVGMADQEEVVGAVFCGLISSCVFRLIFFCNRSPFLDFFFQI